MVLVAPIPKRSSERIRRNKPDVPIEKVSVIGAVRIPDLGIDDAHPITVNLYQSLRESGQSRYFEPSDWAYARFCLTFADKLLKSQRPSGPVLATVHSMMGDLLVSEGARRRFRVEVERSTQDEEGEVLDVASLFKLRLAQG